VERETEAYYKMDPDPFDDRHPGMYTYYNSLSNFGKIEKNEIYM
jgi:hypothetical protein